MTDADKHRRKTIPHIEERPLQDVGIDFFFKIYRKAKNTAVAAADHGRINFRGVIKAVPVLIDAINFLFHLC